MELTHEFTYNLYSGITLILKAYPNAESGIDGFEYSISFEDTGKLTEEDKQLLRRWGWRSFNSSNVSKSYWDTAK